MAISHELSGDIATAILLRRVSSSRDRKKLKEIVLRVHTVLHDLEQEGRRKRVRRKMRPLRRHFTKLR